jgi:recA bacterial DNA recombination protein
MSSSRAHLEALLRTRNLDRTLTSAAMAAQPAIDRVAPVGIATIDRQLRGGFLKGQLSEIVGARSAGRTTVLHALLAAATARGEFVALVDSLDTFDPASAAEAGVDLERLLWVRGSSISSHPVAASEGSLFQTACDRALKAFNLILQAGGAATPVVAVLDLADMPAPTVRRIPFMTWLRLQRVIEGSESVALLVADASLGRSARGVTLRLASASPARQTAQTAWWHMPPFSCQPSVVSAQSAG